MLADRDALQHASQACRLGRGPPRRVAGGKSASSHQPPDQLASLLYLICCSLQRVARDFDSSSNTIEVCERILHAMKITMSTPVESCELPTGIQLVYADDRDRQRTVALEGAAL